MDTKTRILDNLTPAQRKAVTCIDGPLLVLAGAGSGKTRVVTRRVGYLIEQGVAPESIVAITFTNKAANEMSRRVDETIGQDNKRNPVVSTFHSFCVLLLRRYGEKIGLSDNFTIFDSADSVKLVKNACADPKRLPSGLTPAKIANVISGAKTRMISPDEIQNQPNVEKIIAAKIAEIYRNYEKLLRDNNALDFADLLLRGMDLLNNDDARDAIHRRYHYFLIDEYQDTNRIQYLLAKRLSEHTTNICATGDPDQSIYTWRGADISNILDFEDDYPNAKVVFLENNYRSTSYILQAANSLITQNKRRKEKRLIPIHGRGTKIQVHCCEDEGQEAEKVSELIKKAQSEGRKLSEIAIMSRVNSLFINIEQELAQKNIPYQLARGVSFFRRKEIKNIVAYLRVVVNHTDQAALENIINVPTRGIGAKAQATLKQYAKDKGISLYRAIFEAPTIEALGKSKSNVLVFSQMLAYFSELAEKENSAERIVREILEKSNLLEYYKRIGEKEHRPDELSPHANLMELANIAAKFDAENPDGTLADFIAEISLVSDIDSVNQDEDCVLLLTMHSAKGLEFEEVIIIGAEEDILPHAFSKEDDKLEEERRLMFVAITRAKKEIHISYTEHRSGRGSYRPVYPSRFLKELDPQTVEGLDVSVCEPTKKYNQFTISPRKPFQDEAAKTTRARSPFKPGQRVYHKAFGYGVVQEVYLIGSRYTGKILFHGHGLKKLVFDMAPLVPVKD